MAKVDLNFVNLYKGTLTDQRKETKEFQGGGDVWEKVASGNEKLEHIYLVKKPAWIGDKYRALQSANNYQQAGHAGEEGIVPEPRRYQEQKEKEKYLDKDTPPDPSNTEIVTQVSRNQNAKTIWGRINLQQSKGKEKKKIKRLETKLKSGEDSKGKRQKKLREFFHDVRADTGAQVHQCSEFRKSAIRGGGANSQGTVQESEESSQMGLEKFI